MLLWILIAFLTAAAILAVLTPLGRPPRMTGAAAHATQVYREQLAELDRDRCEGRIGMEEADAARAELGRRLIALNNEVAEDVGSAQPVGSTVLRRAVALVALCGIPAGALGLYLALGAPALPGAPLAARLESPPTPNDVDLMVAKVEEHLASNPEDGRGWDVIAPVYLRLGRAPESISAYRNAIRILGSTAAREEGLGQAILEREGGVVTAEAKAAFETAVKVDPKAPVSRFFLALAAEQSGETDDAKRGFEALRSEAPPDTQLRAAVEEALSRLRVPAGPSEAQVAAAEAMPEADRSAMVESMVSRLAARLKDQPDDVEGWLRLIRSYMVLGRAEEASEAARAALAGVRDSGSRERVAALLADLGLTPAGQAQ